MFGRATIYSNGRTIANVAGPVCGFLVVVLVWSLLVGDWQKGDEFAESHLDFVTLESQRKLPVWKQWSNIEDVFVFGDSYSATWFNTAGEQPTKENPFGNVDSLPFDKNAEGPKWINFLASTYNRSTMRVFNFAIAGSVVERHAYEPRLQGIAPSPDSVTFKEQVDNAFRRNYVRKPEWVRWQGYAPEQNIQTWNGSTALFATWFGVNDILQAVVKGKQIPIDAIFASYSASFERLYRFGARNFLILNVPPIDRILGDKTGRIRRDISDYNPRVYQMRAKLAKRHNDVTMFLFDAYTLFNDALDQPNAFVPTAELRNVTAYCPAYALGTSELDTFIPECGHPRDQYFWLNSVHPTHPVQNLTALKVVDDCFGQTPVGYCT